MPKYIKSLESPTVLENLRESALLESRIRVEVDSRRVWLKLHRREDIGWYVRQNNDLHAWPLVDCFVSYDKASLPIRFLYRAPKQGPLLEAPKSGKIKLEPRNPDWDATMREETEAERRGRNKIVTQVRAALLPKAAARETYEVLKECQRWLAAVEQQARLASSPAADMTRDVLNRLNSLLSRIRD